MRRRYSTGLAASTSASAPAAPAAGPSRSMCTSQAAACTTAVGISARRPPRGRLKCASMPSKRTVKPSAASPSSSPPASATHGSGRGCAQEAFGSGLGPSPPSARLIALTTRFAGSKPRPRFSGMRTMARGSRNLKLSSCSSDDGARGAAAATAAAYRSSFDDRYDPFAAPGSVSNTGLFSPMHSQGQPQLQGHITPGQKGAVTIPGSRPQSKPGRKGKKGSVAPAPATVPESPVPFPSGTRSMPPLSLYPDDPNDEGYDEYGVPRRFQTMEVDEGISVDSAVFRTTAEAELEAALEEYRQLVRAGYKDFKAEERARFAERELARIHTARVNGRRRRRLEQLKKQQQRRKAAFDEEIEAEKRQFLDWCATLGPSPRPWPLSLALTRSP
mmetsp:Transcript_9014/g.26222  ORF Transcript_9014/g.26222 Transcript_9014/m.26222 type:complete len:388 (-) Transcript_9014:766-1929(-)